MPISIYRQDENPIVEVAWLCDNSWELPAQVEALQDWLAENGKTLSNDHYIADIGFDVRQDACGGGAVITLKMMQIMVDLHMELYLSEYPNTNKQVTNHGAPTP